ncbi:MAG: beta strand repeat-containing protein [Bacteroidia bacterium]
MKKIVIIVAALMALNSNAQNIGIGNTNPQAKLSIGATSQFQVDSIGNIKKINNVVYSFPTDQGGNGQVLVNNGLGSLSWVNLPATLSSLNGLNSNSQTFATGTSGTDFSINSSGSTHTFNFPNASSSSRGLLLSTDWSTFNNKLDRTGNDTMSGNLVLTNPVFIVTPSDPNHAATKQYVDNSTSPISNKLNRSGTDTMSGNLILINPLVVANPTAGNHAVTKQYLDSAGVTLWSTRGNSGTTTGTNFIGTSDNIPLTFKVNNTLSGFLDPNYYSTFYGIGAGNLNNTGINNSASGYEALHSNTTGSWNTGFGMHTLYSNTTGASNSASGNYSLNSNTTGSWNTAYGYQSMQANTTGIQNTANGTNALYSNTTGDNNIANGLNALFSNVAGSNAIAIGNNAMYYSYNSTSAFTNYNIAIGFESLRGSTTAANNTGNINTALGYQTLWSNTTGNNNLANGYQALYSNTTGHENIAVGTSALYSNTTGVLNCAFGYAALYSNTTGLSNTAAGYDALFYNSTGQQNTVSGGWAMHFNTTGSYNSGFGQNALYNNTTGNQNTGLGYQAGYMNTTGSNNVFVGYKAGYNETGSNKLYIANSNTNPPLIYGDFSSGKVGVGTTSPATALDVNGDVTVRGNFYAPGTVVQTIVKISEQTGSLNTTTFTEVDTNYRISIVPKFANSIFLIEYSFSINTSMQNNTVFQMQLVRDIGVTDSLIGAGPANGNRNRTSYVSRPNNGYDSNDMQNVYMVAKDAGLTPGTTYTYGFKYRRETGGSGTCYFNYSNLNDAVFGFSGVMTMKINEIAQ